MNSSTGIPQGAPPPYTPQPVSHPGYSPHPGYLQPGQNSAPNPPGFVPQLNPPGPYSISQTVVAQPRGGPPANWMPPSQAPPGCPPGLEYLTMVDQLLVHQVIEVLEALTGFETENKYHVRNSLGQDVYYAAESSDCCSRNCIGPLREFDMRILDNFQNEVIHFYRPLACASCCYPCCLQTLEVSSPPGTPIGSVQQEWSLIFPSFSIKDANGDTVLRIEGPFWTVSCCNDVNFRLTTADGSTDVGKITKQWSGLFREAYTDADNFSISFPGGFGCEDQGCAVGSSISN